MIPFCGDIISFLKKVPSTLNSFLGTFNTFDTILTLFRSEIVVRKVHFICSSK